MNKTVVGVAIGVIVATAGGAIASLKMKDRAPEFAQVTAVKTITKTVRTPREECQDVTVTEKAPTRDPHRITGTAIGAVAGGVIGNQIGDGSGRDIARVAGAVAGGYAGNRVQKRMQDRRTVTTTHRECQTVYDTHEENDGYDVSYQLGEQTGTVRMDHDPGERIPVKDGQLVLGGTASVEG